MQIEYWLFSAHTLCAPNTLSAPYGATGDDASKRVDCCEPLVEEYPKMVNILSELFLGPLAEPPPRELIVVKSLLHAPFIASFFPQVACIIELALYGPEFPKRLRSSAIMYL